LPRVHVWQVERIDPAQADQCAMEAQQDVRGPQSSALWHGKDEPPITGPVRILLRHRRSLAIEETRSPRQLYGIDPADRARAVEHNSITIERPFATNNGTAVLVRPRPGRIVRNVRQRDVERTPPLRRALRPDPAAMAAHDLLADVEAKAHTGDVARRAVGRAVKEPEDRLELVRRDPDPLIARGEPHA